MVKRVRDAEGDKKEEIVEPVLKTFTQFFLCQSDPIYIGLMLYGDVFFFPQLCMDL